MTPILLIALACLACLVPIAAAAGYATGRAESRDVLADWQASCRRAERAAELWRRCAAGETERRVGGGTAGNRG